MEKIFLFLGTDYSYKKFIPLIDELKEFTFCCFSDEDSLLKGLTLLKPIALLIDQDDFNQNFLYQFDLFPKNQIRIFVTGTSYSDHSDLVLHLPEDFSAQHLYAELVSQGSPQRKIPFSAEMLNLIIQHIPVSLSWKDHNLKYIGCNRVFFDKIGREKECEIVGLTDFDIFSPEVAEQNIANDLKVLNTGNALLNYEEEVKNADGSIIYLKKSRIPIKDSAGKVVIIIGISENITQQVVLQEHLQTEKNYLQMLMDNIPDTIYFKDRNSKFIKINKAQSQLLGLSNPEDAKGSSDADFFDAFHSYQAYLDEQELMASGLPLVNKLEHIYTAIGLKYVLATKVPIFNENGDCTGMVGISRDVTREHQVEEELKFEKELMSLLMDNIPDRIYFKDNKSRFTRVNKAVVDLFGVSSANDLYGKTDFDFHDKEHAKQAFDDEQRMLETGIPIINKLENHITTGERIWELSTKIPLYGKNKEKLGLVGVSRDFTHEKQLGESLEKERDLLQTLMDNVPDFIFFKDTESRYLRINKAVESALRVDNSFQVIGKTDYDFFSPEVADGFCVYEKEIFQEGKSVVNKVEKTFLLDGREIWLSTTKIPIRDKNGETTGLVGISRDVTVQEITREHMREAKEKAEEANQAKSLFLANMSHEIRTPMNGVIGMADILKRTTLNDSQKEYLDIIMKSGQTLLTIINDILDFSKIESGKLKMESAPISIRSIVEEVADIQILHANDKKIDLLTFVDAEVPESVNGDYVRVKQVLTNLVNNAIKFTSKGEVFVSVSYIGFSENRHEVIFSVKDTGIGIAQTDIEKLFKSFSQVDTSTTRRFGGTGLGLAISQRLVGQMDGEFNVESQPGMGSVFSFTARFDPAEVPSEIGLLLKDVAFSGKNILIVDDNTTNRKIFREYLERWNMNVEEAVDAYIALQKIDEWNRKSETLDVVLVDFQMPGMDGLEFARKIKENPIHRNLKLILLSSVTDAIPREEVKKSGFEHYLNKPVKLKQLFNVLASLFGKLKHAAVTKEDDFDPLKSVFAGTKFMVVEDNDVNMKVALFTLKSLTTHILPVTDGQAAVDAFNREKLDYILMDIQMPGMNGIDATLKIREIEQKANVLNPVKIIAMTANTMQEDVERCLEAGMDAFLSKPFRLSDLMQVLEAINNAGSEKMTN